MRGDERVRFCAQCSLNVYNLSDMTRREAEGLLARAEGRLCVRFYRRPDGTILTSNCPVGLRAIKRRVSKTVSAALSAVMGFFAGIGIAAGVDQVRSINDEAEVENTRMMGVMAVKPLQPIQPSIGEPVMGDVAPAVWANGQVTVGRAIVPKQSSARPLRLRTR
jgi:hypothetical protein